MAGTTAFNLTGATPQTTNTSTPMFGTSMGGTPQSRALTNLQGSNYLGGQGLQLNPPPVAPPAPTGQQVASHTVAHPDGTTVTQKYVPTSGLINSGGTSSGTTGTTPTPQPTPFSGATNGLLGIGTGGGASTVNTSTSNLNNTATNQGASANPTTPAGQINTATTGLLNQSANASPDVVAAEKSYNDFSQTAPYMKAAQYNPSVAADIASGRGQVLGQTFAAEQAAKAQAVQNALTEQGQQITAGNEAGALAGTAQGQQITAGTNAGTLGIGQQNAQTSALQNAGNLTQPSPAGYGQTVFNPATGTYTGGSAGVSPNDPFYATLQQYAQMAANGQISAIPASITGNPVLNAQVNQLAKEQNPNYNPVVSAAQGAAAASNVSTTGTAAVNAANTGYQGAVQEYQDNTAKYTALTGISNQVTGTLSNYANTGKLTNLNSAINTISGLTSDPNYQQFVTAIGNAQASYQAILGSSGVTPTKADQDAVAALNPNSSASTIVAALNQLSADAHSLIIVPAYQKVNNYKTQLGI